MRVRRARLWALPKISPKSNFLITKTVDHQRTKQQLGYFFDVKHGYSVYISECFHGGSDFPYRFFIYFRLRPDKNVKRHKLRPSGPKHYLI